MGIVNSAVQSGTFTPTIQDSSLSDGESQTYVAQEGLYRKVGDVIEFWLRIQSSSAGSLTGGDTAIIAGLPFSCGTIVGQAQSYYASGVAVGGGYSVGGFISVGADYITLQKWSSTGGCTNLTITELSIPSTIYLHGSYIAA